jgi:hypothetical protein
LPRFFNLHGLGGAFKTSRMKVESRYGAHEPWTECKGAFCSSLGGNLYVVTLPNRAALPSAPAPALRIDGREARHVVRRPRIDAAEFECLTDAPEVAVAG